MSLVIFFGMALFIFLSGVFVLALTFYQWRKDKKNNLKKINFKKEEVL